MLFRSRDFVRDVVFDRSRPQYVYAGGTFETLLYSRDGGESWKAGKALDNLGRTPRGWALPVIDPFDPNVIYTSASLSYQGVYKSIDAGVTWRFVAPPAFSALIMDPRNQGVIYGLGGDAPAVSRDGGESWTFRPWIQSPDLPPGNFLNLDKLAFDPVDQTTLYLWNIYGEVYRSDDGGQTVRRIDGLPPNSNIRTLYFDPNTSGKWLALCFFWADAFVTRFSEDGGTTVFSTFLGGSGSESADGIAIDGQGNVLVVGRTDSADFPGAQDSFGRNPKAFLVQLASDGSRATVKTLLRTGGQSPPSIAVDQVGNILMAGSAFTSGFVITSDAVQKEAPPFTPEGPDTVGFFLRMTPAGEIKSASYLGGVTGYSSVAGVAIAPSGRVCYAGNTAAPDLQTTSGAFQGSLKKLTDAFLVTIDFVP